MFILFLGRITTVYWAESHPHLLIHGAAQTGTATAPAGNMEARRSVSASLSPHSSPTSPPTPVAVRSTPCTTRFTPLGGMMVLINLMFGEVVFWRRGFGLYGMLIWWCSRSSSRPHGGPARRSTWARRIEAYDVENDQCSTCSSSPSSSSRSRPFSCSRPPSASAAWANQGPPRFHRDSSNAFTSAAANNGSAFAGLNANTWCTT